MSASGAASLSADLSATLQARLQQRLKQCLHAAVRQAGGWLPFDRFMAMALYEPGLGYYSSGSPVFGAMPASGSDFVTAPEMTLLFGQALARQVAQALQLSGSSHVVEFGAGSGALAQQLLQALGSQVQRYSIVDVSGALRARQARRLASFGDRVQWLDTWPDGIEGVVVGNEVLDAMPVQLLHWDGTAWHERGVALHGENLVFADRPTDLRPPTTSGFVPGTTVEIQPQAQAFIRTLAGRLQRGAAFFIDYGFPEHEFFHPQRTGGTLMCHRGHVADTDPLADVGLKDITAHVDFSGVALAGQDAGLDVLGYTSQAHFLLNCGLLQLIPAGDVRATAAVQKLVNEHEMGELFKVIGFARGVAFGADGAIGFTTGDRSHTL